MSSNPKLINSGIIDCIPQTGECTMNCEGCFYNGGRFYRTLNEPLIPSLEESVGSVVRMNSSHDSNLERDKVIETAARYEHVFFNTAIPRFDFPGPVVFTCNAHHLILVQDPPKNIMYVRFRVATNNLEDADKAVEHYWVKHQIPVVMTFMRYYDEASVPDKDSYEWRKSVINNYWMIKPEVMIKIMSRWNHKDPPIYGVRMCGTPYSSFCGDCRNCWFLYWDCKRKLDIERV